MGTVDKQGAVTMQELLVSSLATADALAKLLIEEVDPIEVEKRAMIIAYSRCLFQEVFCMDESEAFTLSLSKVSGSNITAIPPPQLLDSR